MGLREGDVQDREREVGSAGMQRGETRMFGQNFRKLGTWTEAGQNLAILKIPGGGALPRRRRRATGTHAPVCGPSHVEGLKMAAAQAVEEMRTRVVLGEFGVRNVSLWP